MADIKRLRYYTYQYLQKPDFRDEQFYHVDMRRRLNKTLRSYGIIEGFTLKLEKDNNKKIIKVNPGIAVDEEGREIILDEEMKIFEEPLQSNSILRIVVEYYEEPSNEPLPPFNINNLEPDDEAEGGDNMRYHENPKFSIITKNGLYVQGKTIILGKVRTDQHGNIYHGIIEDDREYANVHLASEGGKVGIGTKNPKKLLHVNGMAIKPGGGPWGNSSDKKLKKNIKLLKNALSKLTKLRGVSFEWKNPLEHGNQIGVQIGMIAQEVEPIFPNWISETDDGVKIMSITGFEALTVEAIKELKSDNERLNKRITILEKKLKNQNNGNNFS